MSDLDHREAERHWRLAPDDDLARSHAVQAFRRAGLDLPFDLLIRLDRWRPIVDFIRDWDERPLAAGEGYASDELDETEQRLGNRLPMALREWFLLGGPGFAGPCGTTRPPDALELSEGRLLFASDEESSGVWAVDVPALSLEDPPVSVGRRGGGMDWTKDYDALSRFIFTKLVHDAIRGNLGELQHGMAEMTPDGIRVLERNYGPLSLPVSRWPFPTAFFGDPETLLEIDQDPSMPYVNAAARTPEAWRRLDALIRSHSAQGAWLFTVVGEQP